MSQNPFKLRFRGIAYGDPITPEALEELKKAIDLYLRDPPPIQIIDFSVTKGVKDGESDCHVSYALKGKSKLPPNSSANNQNPFGSSSDE